MSELSVVERLYFGRDDAERDFADGLLQEGFKETAAYNAVVSGRKMMVIGRKGVGKSAICVRLASAGAPHYGGTALITPDDAAGEEIRQFELAGLTGDHAKSLMWRYVFALRAAQYVVRHAADHAGRPPASVKALRSFLKANQELIGEPRDSSGFGQWLQGLRGSLSLEAFGVKASADFNQTPTEGARAAHRLRILEDGVRGAFVDLGCAPAHRLLLLVDQLEQVWSADVESNSLIIGLLLAARHLGSQYGSSLKCALFLRSDIYDALSFGEGDKFRSDELRVEWTGSDLEDLVLRRARASVRAELTAQQLWGGIFPRTVRGRDTASYLLSHALPRPRDLIQYLNECQSTAIGNGHHDRIHESDIVTATRRFSEWKLKDLVQEYLVAHPFLERLFPLFQNSGYLVTRAALRSRVEWTQDTLRREFPAYAQALTLDGIIRTLYEVGFLGVRRGHGTVYAGVPLLPVQPHEDEFHLHPCFREALGATSAAGIGAYDRLVADSIRGQVGSGHVDATARGVTRVSRGHALLGRLQRACRSILDRATRSDGLPAEVRTEIVTQVRRILDDTEHAPYAEPPVAEDRIVLAAASYFHSLASRLRRDAMDGGDVADGLAAHLTEQSTRLVRAVGGGLVGSGES
ncbi:P-loop ATPase, Sll1717 family [Streptomyces avermitilis]|uniref:P-loop ATPase, Sll1717 family n=1 Tax=Streptomyces avermitilis TaxID=33903 RepID=UPI0037F484CA